MRLVFDHVEEVVETYFRGTKGIDQATLSGDNRVVCHYCTSANNGETVSHAIKELIKYNPFTLEDWLLCPVSRTLILRD